MICDEVTDEITDVVYLQAIFTQWLHKDSDVSLLVVLSFY